MKAILVDDEPLALDFLERQLNKISDILVIGKFTYFDINKNVNLLEEVDIAFLDIEMPETNGLEVAGQLLEIKPDLVIIFVTAFNDYAVDAFELNTLDYVVKPIQLDRLKKTIERIEIEMGSQIDKPSSEDHNLRINVCGELTFELIKDTFEVVQWRTTKAQELFLYLLHHSGKTTRKSELAELLWPEFDPNKAYSQLYTAIYHARNALNKFSNYFSLKNMSDGYALFTKNTSVDVVKWESSIKSAPPVSPETIVEYEKKMNLYTDAYLLEYDYLWAESERYRLEQLWLKIAHQMANYYDERDDLEQAETWYVKICNLRPEDENAHFSLMKLYDVLGYGVLVDHQFVHLKNALKELSIQVSPHIQKWYNQRSSNRKDQKLIMN